jgi:hypothetical protein
VSKNSPSLAVACWLSVEGVPEPIPLTGGDCILLARGTSFVLRDSLRTRLKSSFREIASKDNSHVAHYGGGGAPTTIVFGSLSFDRASLKPITQLLPSFILIKADQAHTLALHNTTQALASEMAEQAPGYEVVATRLAEVSRHSGHISRREWDGATKDGFVRFSTLKWAPP